MGIVPCKKKPTDFSAKTQVKNIHTLVLKSILRIFHDIQVWTDYGCFIFKYVASEFRSESYPIRESMCFICRNWWITHDWDGVKNIDLDGMGWYISINNVCVDVYVYHCVFYYSILNCVLHIFYIVRYMYIYNTLDYIIQLYCFYYICIVMYDIQYMKSNEFPLFIEWKFTILGFIIQLGFAVCLFFFF